MLQDLSDVQRAVTYRSCASVSTFGQWALQSAEKNKKKEYPRPRRSSDNLLDGPEDPDKCLVRLSGSYGYNGPGGWTGRREEGRKIL